jgi:hypothetical protein
VDSIEQQSAAESLELIRAGLSGLAACDIDSYGAAGLGEECEQILRAAGELQIQAARRLARFDALGGPAADHSPSLSNWLGRRCRLRPWEASQLATTAARLHLLNDTLNAYHDEKIGYGDVATIAAGVDAAAETMAPDWSPERIAETAQPILLEVAPRITPGQLRRAAGRVALTLDGASAERRRKQIERQAFLDLGQTLDGVGTMRAEMGAMDLAVLEKAVDAFGSPPDPEAPSWQNAPGHRRLGGLITACRIALGEASGHGFRERGGAPVRVHLIAPAAAVDPDVPAEEAPPARTEYGTLMSAGELREMIARHSAQVTRVGVREDGSVADRYTADGRPLDWGRTRRLFTAAQRDIYLAIHAGCMAEGCDRPLAWSDIDHQRAWVDGGRTDLDNGQPLCRWHNLDKENNRNKEAGRQPRPRQRRNQDRSSREPSDPDH